jgi:hypothetical protein
MTVEELAKSTGLTTVTLPDNTREIHGAYVGDLLSWVMGRASSDNAWITIMSNVNVIAVATLADVSCVIFAEGVIPDKELIKVAEAKGVNLLTSPLSSYETAVRISEFV